MSSATCWARSAKNSSTSAAGASARCAWSRRSVRIRPPITVPPGSWVRTVRGPSRLARRPACVLFPLPSIPSKVTNGIPHSINAGRRGLDRAPARQVRCTAMLDLGGRVALVTGGSRGIGRAVCLLMGRVGARVAVNYVRDTAAAETVVAAIRSAGGEAVALQADVSDPAAAEALVAETETRLGPLDILVVNHGIWKHAPLLDMTPGQWAETLRVNLDGAYGVCRAAAARMTTRGRGAIVLVASTAGQRGEAEYSHYAASKGAILAFTKSLA